MYSRVSSRRCSILSTRFASSAVATFSPTVRNQASTKQLDSFARLLLRSRYSATVPSLDSTRCQKLNSIMLPIISVLPLFWRMMQCLKRYYTTRDKVHLPNAGKYAAGLSVVLFSSLMGNFQGTHTGTLAPLVRELPAD